MNGPASPLNAFPATQEAEAVCDHCRKPFTPTRGWARFCSSACRNGFHAPGRRAKAIQDRAPAMFEALRRIAAGDLGDGETAASVATAAIKGLKAP